MQKLKQNLRSVAPFVGVLLFVIALRFVARMPLPASSAEQPSLVTAAEAADAINSELPMMVDEYTELMNVAGFGNTLVYNYRLIHVDPQDVSKREVMDYFNEEVKPAAIRQGCSTPDMRQWYDNGVTVRFAYHYADRTYIGHYDVTLADCPRG